MKKMKKFALVMLTALIAAGMVGCDNSAALYESSVLAEKERIDEEYNKVAKGIAEKYEEIKEQAEEVGTLFDNPPEQKKGYKTKIMDCGAEYQVPDTWEEPEKGMYYPNPDDPRIFIAVREPFSSDSLEDSAVREKIKATYSNEENGYTKFKPFNDPDGLYGDDGTHYIITYDSDGNMELNRVYAFTYWYEDDAGDVYHEAMFFVDHPYGMIQFMFSAPAGEALNYVEILYGIVLRMTW